MLKIILGFGLLFLSISMAQGKTINTHTAEIQQRQIELEKQHKIVAERWRLPLKNHGAGYYGKRFQTP